MSSDTIAIQILSFSTQATDLGSICSNISGKLISKIEAIKERYKLNIYFEIHFKCSSGHYYKDIKSYRDLFKTKEYFCTQHTEVHQSKKIYLPWMMNTYTFTDEEIRFLRIVALLHVAEDAVRIVFDYEFHPEILHKWIHSERMRTEAKLRQYLTNMQWKTFYDTPANEASSRKFDLHLMLCLLRNIAYLNIENEFKPWETSYSSYLSRIWYCSSQMSKHSNGKLAKEDFKNYFDLLNESIIRLGKQNQNLDLKRSRIKKCDLDDRSKISPEETNYLRILHLILNVARNVVQLYFDLQFPPSTLHATIKSNMTRLQEKISDYQYRLLFSSKGKALSVSYDIKTMILLLRYLKGISITESLPINKSNTYIGADLSRIYWYRREVIHCNTFTVGQFEDRWYNISEVLVRLGGDRYTDICKHLKTALLLVSDPLTFQHDSIYERE